MFLFVCRMVMSYLVHHGYCSTAEAFAKTCGQIVAEDLVSMQNRQSKFNIHKFRIQVLLASSFAIPLFVIVPFPAIFSFHCSLFAINCAHNHPILFVCWRYGKESYDASWCFSVICTEIQKLVLDGEISEAEAETKILYPTLLDSNPDLLFMLRCRHFVELVGNSMKRKSRSRELGPHAEVKKACNGHSEGWSNGKPKSSLPYCHCDEMEVTYTNGYQNGCSTAEDGMGTTLHFLFQFPFIYFKKMN